MSTATGMFDLVVRGGTVVTERGEERVDVAIDGERVAAVGPELRGRQEVDASGRLVLPGGVDPHVHLTAGPEYQTGRAEEVWADDFESGSRAAAAGGITTIGNMTFAGERETMLQAIAREAGWAESQSVVDVFLHAVVDPLQLATVEAQVRELAERGHRSIKIFMSDPSFDHCSPGFIIAMQAAARAGSMVLIHCEDSGIIRCCTERLLAGGARGFDRFDESRPPLSEVAAIERALTLAELAGAWTYLVHVSLARAIERCHEARTRGLPIFVETRPMYLHLTADRYREPEPALVIGQPPLRSGADRDGLWAGLRSGRIDVVASDHAPWRREQKLSPKHTLRDLRPGVADLDTMLPMLFSAGVGTGRLSLAQFVALTATNPARLFGLHPRKGTIAVGSDADLAVWDANEARTIRGAELRSRAGHSPYEGQKVRGWPVLTLRRGAVVYERGSDRGAPPGSGRVLVRGPSLPPVAHPAVRG